jgi:hypothetical protein
VTFGCRETIPPAATGTSSQRSSPEYGVAMRETFKGFLVLRLAGLLALVIVVAIVLGIRALARGSDVAGVAFIVVAVVFAVGLGSLVARHVGTRHR